MLTSSHLFFNGGINVTFHANERGERKRSLEAWDRRADIPEDGIPEPPTKKRRVMPVIKKVSESIPTSPSPKAKFNNNDNGDTNTNTNTNANAVADDAPPVTDNRMNEIDPETAIFLADEEKEKYPVATPTTSAAATTNSAMTSITAPTSMAKTPIKSSMRNDAVQISRIIVHDHAGHIGIEIPKSELGKVCGQKGGNIGRIRHSTNASIIVMPEDMPKISENSKLILIQGSRLQMIAAKDEIIRFAQKDNNNCKSRANPPPAILWSTITNK